MTAPKSGVPRKANPVDTAAMSSHYLIDPETVTLVDDEGDVVRSWDTPGGFVDELVWAGCPLFHDPSGEVFIDVELADHGTPTRVHINNPLLLTAPLAGQTLEIITRWQHHHDL